MLFGNSVLYISPKRKYSYHLLVKYNKKTQKMFVFFIHAFILLIEHEGIVKSLDGENMVAPYEGAANAGLLIDCIWFKNGRFMPAVMEVEHTTGVKSGLMRMLNFSRKLPRFDDTRYVIVAPDDDRDKVIRYANEDSFRELDARYFAYSAVEELYAICQRRHLHGITQEFLDCYMEKVVND